MTDSLQITENKQKDFAKRTRKNIITKIDLAYKLYVNFNAKDFLEQTERTAKGDENSTTLRL